MKTKDKHVEYEEERKVREFLRDKIMTGENWRVENRLGFIHSDYIVLIEGNIAVCPLTAIYGSLHGLTRENIFQEVSSLGSLKRPELIHDGILKSAFKGSDYSSVYIYIPTSDWYGSFTSYIVHVVTNTGYTANQVAEHLMKSGIKLTVTTLK